LAHVMVRPMDEANPPKRPATYEDLLKVPDTKVAELIDGELYVFSRPASPHAYAAFVLGGHVYAFEHRGNGPRGWWILPEPELHLGSDVLVPDLAAWRVERLPKIPQIVGHTLPPDWVCEVVSPSTERVDRLKKLRVYAREGIGYCWLIDPLKRQLEIRRLEAGEWMLLSIHRDNEVINPEPFEALPLPLAKLWADLAPA
jgi:Uma2 family endonuclease